MSYTKDKVIIIRGASSGIGEGSAIYLAEKGAKVILAARSEDKLKNLSEHISKNGGTALYKTTDVTIKEKVQALIDFVVAKFKRVDTLVNSAGMMLFSMWDNAHVEEWDL